MKRRAFTAGALALAAAPFAARAQAPGKTYRIALVATGFPVERMTETGEPRFAAFLTEMKRFGYAEGGNLALSRWSTAGLSESQFENLATQVVASRPDIIANGSRLVLALKDATATASIPVVFLSAADPLGWGLVGSLSRPGGNVTGFSADAAPEMTGKRLQFLRETSPGMKRVAYLATPQMTGTNTASELREAAAKVALPFDLVVVEPPIREQSIERALAQLPDRVRSGVVISAQAEFTAAREVLAAVALRLGLPTIGAVPELARSGCLMSYGQDFAGAYRRAAEYVDRILKGAKPADLPVQQPTMFEFVINLRTAKALGLSVPEHLLVFGTEIIE
jgi:putative tryptophan/tyrosine transport system substrate-binding protein